MKMQKASIRQTEQWFQNKNFTGESPFKSGPGAYNFQDY